jgi:hypothetical protein
VPLWATVRVRGDEAETLEECLLQETAQLASATANNTDTLREDIGRMMWKFLRLRCDRIGTLRVLRESIQNRGSVSPPRTGAGVRESYHAREYASPRT